MLSKLFISSSLETSQQVIGNLLKELNLSQDHPDVLWISGEEKSLGVEEAKKIREHFLLKPVSAKGRVVVILKASSLTDTAQNSLLKLLEEPPLEAALFLSAQSDSGLLPTVTSRCEVIYLPSKETIIESSEQISRLLSLNLEKRFEFIEGEENKEELINQLAIYYQNQLRVNPQDFPKAKLVLQAQQWLKANVNPRAILEYLMLSL